MAVIRIVIVLDTTLPHDFNCPDSDSGSTSWRALVDRIIERADCAILAVNPVSPEMAGLALSARAEEGSDRENAVRDFALQNSTVFRLLDRHQQHGAVEYRVLIAVHSGGHLDTQAAPAIAYLHLSFPRFFGPSATVTYWHYSKSPDGKVGEEAERLRDALRKKGIDLADGQSELRSNAEDHPIEDQIGMWCEVQFHRKQSHWNRPHRNIVQGWILEHLQGITSRSVGVVGHREALDRRLRLLLRHIDANDDVPKVRFVDDEAFDAISGTTRTKSLSDTLAALFADPRIGSVRFPVETIGRVPGGDWSTGEIARRLRGAALSTDLDVLVWVMDFLLVPDEMPGSGTAIEAFEERGSFRSEGLEWVYIASRSADDLANANALGIAGGLRRNLIYHVGPHLFGGSKYGQTWDGIDRYREDLETCFDSPRRNADGVITHSPKVGIRVPVHAYVPLLEFILRRLEHDPTDMWERASSVLTTVFRASRPEECASIRCHGRCDEALRKSICTRCVGRNLGNASLFCFHYDRLLTHRFWKRVVLNKWSSLMTESDPNSIMVRAGLSPEETKIIMDHVASILIDVMETGELSAKSKGYLVVIRERLSRNTGFLDLAGNLGICPRLAAGARM
jgi:hypothetical protein